MTQPASNLIKPFSLGDIAEYPVLTNVHIFEGAAVGIQLSSGYVRQLVATTDLDRFVGFAQTEADNNPGSSGDKRVFVLTRGVVPLVVVGVDGQDDVSKDVYASDGGTFTLTQADDTVRVGRVHRHLSGTSCQVKFDADEQSHQAAIANVTVTGSDADSVARTGVNAILAVLRNAGMIRANT